MPLNAIRGHCFFVQKLDIYRSLIRPALFRLDPEKAHELAFGFLKNSSFVLPLLRSMYAPESSEMVKIGNITFRNRLGLAAGLDKNGEALPFWDALGFSHAEIGTVTPLPQPGNEKPRLFRLASAGALINRMGFNNPGSAIVRENMLKTRHRLSAGFVTGINIGKNKLTPMENAAEDYMKCMESLYDVADYFTVNISSPNTPGLRQLQDEKHLGELLSQLKAKNVSLADSFKSAPKDIFLKIAPDLGDESLPGIISACRENAVTAVIATNTTVSRPGLGKEAQESGGLSGRPLKNLSDSVLAKLNSIRRTSAIDMPHLIGVGGVFSRSDYDDKIAGGAELVQIYTGLIYEGPGIIKQILGR